MAKEKGITLIALIITIIVMLILVAVTISVALNGGIFNNAREAKTGTQRQAEKEELIATMVGAYTSSGNFATSNVGDLPGGAKWCNEDTEVWSENLNVNPTGNGDWIITTNNNKFYIDASGSVLDEKPLASVDDLIPNAQQKTDGETSTIGVYVYADESINYEESGNVKYVQISVLGGAYFWACDDSSAAELATMLQIEGMQACKWYFGTESFTLYTGACPIDESNYTTEELKSKTYVDRVIASFSSTNN